VENNQKEKNGQEQKARKIMIYIKLNRRICELSCPSYYSPVVVLDLQAFQMFCTKVNSITIIIRHPRTNVDMITSVFKFYFDETMYGSDGAGQVHSNYTRVYNIGDPARSDGEDDSDNPCILLFNGRQLTHVFLYVPYHRDQRFLREIRLFRNPRTRGSCPICMEDDVELVDLHDNAFGHRTCMSCAVRIDKCPICREICGRHEIPTHPVISTTV